MPCPPLRLTRPGTTTCGVVAILLLGAACADPPAPVAPDANASEAAATAGHVHSHGSRAAVPISGQVQRQIAQLRDVTAAFHRFEAAVDAGWGTQITECFENPGVGGMGYHYGNVDLIDGAVNPLQPELLLYEPMKNGKLRLVAVEYIVPFDAWLGANPPQLFGQSFHRNEAFGIWALHVWHFDNNPSGMFADWNPGVSCQYAAP